MHESLHSAHKLKESNNVLRARGMAMYVILFFAHNVHAKGQGSAAQSFFLVTNVSLWLLWAIIIVIIIILVSLRKMLLGRGLRRPVLAHRGIASYEPRQANKAATAPPFMKPKKIVTIKVRKISKKSK